MAAMAITARPVMATSRPSMHTPSDIGQILTRLADRPRMHGDLMLDQQILDHGWNLGEAVEKERLC
jgi:hypothetical protein